MCIVNRKYKTSLFYQQKWVYLGIAENCTLGQASCGKTMGKSGKESGSFFVEEGVSWDCCYKQKAHWNKVGAGIMLAFHWLSCYCLLLAGLLLG